MDMDRATLEKISLVNELAARDDDYCNMERDWKVFEKEFEEYVDPLPKEVRNFLWGYAHMGILMGNRKLVLACENMEWIDIKTPPVE